VAVRKGRLIPEPAPNTRTVFASPPGFKGPFMQGPGGDDTVCGKCGAVLLSGIPEGSVRNIVFRCFVCGSFNEV
jgi:hypothetical protein